MRKMMQRSLSCLLTLAMVVTMLMTSTLAAEKSVKITLEYPKDVPANDVVVTMFKGIPAWYQKREAKTVEGIVKAFTEPNSENYPKLTIIEPDKDGKYTVTEAGGYCYLVRGKVESKYYSIVKLFLVTEADLKAGAKTLPVKTAPIAGTGYETSNNNPVGVNGEKAPAGFDQGVGYGVPIEGTDEMEYLLGTDELVGYKPFTTPAFQEGRALYQATTNEEMTAFIKEYATKSSYMHVFSAGKTAHYGYDYPVLVFTKKNIPANATMDDAAKILREGGKPIVWQQAQIHPYEPAAGESALVVHGNHDPVFLRDKILRSSAARGDHGKPHRHCLNIGDAKRFAPRRQHKAIRRGIRLGELASRAVAAKGNAAVQPQFGA